MTYLDPPYRRSSILDEPDGDLDDDSEWGKANLAAHAYDDEDDDDVEEDDDEDDFEDYDDEEDDDGDI